MTGESCHEKPTMDSAPWQMMDRVVVCIEKGVGELSSSQGRKVDEKFKGKYCIVHWGISCRWVFLIMSCGGVARVLQRGLRCRLGAREGGGVTVRTKPYTRNRESSVPE